MPDAIMQENVSLLFRNELPPFREGSVMIANYHTHTQRCNHAQGTEEEYVLSALASGMDVLGFSDHAPYPDDSHGRMPYPDLAVHFAEVDRLAGKYASRLRIRKGLEIEYLPRYRDYYEELLTRRKLDYLLLGEHFYPRGDQVPLLMDAKSTEENIYYAEAIREALKTGYFLMLAHPDLFAMNPFAWDDRCERASDIILEAAAETGAVLEFNANGYRRGIHPYPDGDRYMYPHLRFWQKVSGSGLRVIIGADAHEPSQVWDDKMVRARQVLRDLGIEPLTNLEGLLPPWQGGRRQT